ncbi:MAG: head decoration protein [Lentisphaeraceae bacterium]|nr:head decoration protein [Lentisphaeraceae bacterium]
MNLDVIKTRSDVVHMEGDNNYSMKKITVADTHTVELGQVLGQQTASGEFEPLNQDASDGTEVAAAVAISEKEDESGTKEIIAFVRHGILNDAGLVWPDDITEPEKTLALSQLESQGIVVDL